MPFVEIKPKERDAEQLEFLFVVLGIVALGVVLFQFLEFVRLIKFSREEDVGFSAFLPKIVVTIFLGFSAFFFFWAYRQFKMKRSSMKSVNDNVTAFLAVRVPERFIAVGMDGMVVWYVVGVLLGLDLRQYRDWWFIVGIMVVIVVMVLISAVGIIYFEDWARMIYSSVSYLLFVEFVVEKVFWMIWNWIWAPYIVFEGWFLPSFVVSFPIEVFCVVIELVAVGLCVVFFLPVYTRRFETNLKRSVGNREKSWLRDGLWLFNAVLMVIALLFFPRSMM